jgi:hypothetical protein
VVPVPPKEEALWRELGAGGMSIVLGKYLPMESYQRILNLVEEYRR